MTYIILCNEIRSFKRENHRKMALPSNLQLRGWQGGTVQSQLLAIRVDTQRHLTLIFAFKKSSSLLCHLVVIFTYKRFEPVIHFE